MSLDAIAFILSGAVAGLAGKIVVEEVTWVIRVLRHCRRYPIVFHKRRRE